MVKTIVTMDMGEQIATHYGLRTINVLTGFKFIGEQIGKLEQQGRADSYVFGFEESYGYLTGSYVRDKDGVDGAYMICEMFSYYATKGISLLDKLEELYKTYGYCLNTLHSYEFDGSAGFAKMQNIMQAFRGDIKEFGGRKVVKLLDYAPGLDGLPKSDVLKFLLEDNCLLRTSLERGQRRLPEPPESKIIFICFLLYSLLQVLFSTLTNLGFHLFGSFFILCTDRDIGLEFRLGAGRPRHNGAVIFQQELEHVGLGQTIQTRRVVQQLDDLLTAKLLDIAAECLRDVQLLCDQGHQPAGQVGRAVQGLRILPQHPAQL